MSPITCIPLECWDWRLLGNRWDDRLASIVVLASCSSSSTHFIVAMCTSYTEMATDYGCFELAPCTDIGLRPVAYHDGFGRCTNEPDGAPQLDRDYATMVRDAFLMAIDGHTDDLATALVIGFAADIAPSGDGEYLSDLLSGFQALNGERGALAFWRSVAMAFCIGASSESRHPTDDQIKLSLSHFATRTRQLEHN